MPLHARRSASLALSLAAGLVLLGAGLTATRGGAEPAAPAQDPTQSRVDRSLTSRDISLAQAQAAILAAERKAREINTKMDIAIVDAGGNLKAFARMDGAWLGSIDISIRKAKTARYFDMNTGEIGKLSQPGGPLYGIEHSNDGLITFPGGVPIRNAEGHIIGAIGVSGSTVENDHIVAMAGAEGAK
ncbi:MAG: heme-binding protein [Phycisphaeraceae bacterium]|nr:heme-binding protein [Phycisphaerales bacterium]QOJ19123.1 MAG: heme-binding protein [Phycisphaeraceae bacterium]